MHSSLPPHSVTESLEEAVENVSPSPENPGTSQEATLLTVICVPIPNRLLHAGLGRNSGCRRCPPIENLPVEEFQGAGFEPQQPAEHAQRHQPPEEAHHLAV